jgi:exopolysaccharide production protein ExoQ
MTQPSASPGLRLPRRSRVAARLHDTSPAWSSHLASLTLLAMLALAILGPWMNINNEGLQSELRQLGYAVILVLTLITSRPWRHPERLLVVPWPLLLALGWCWLSLLWALDPLTGLRRLVLTTVVLWSLFALIRQLGSERVITILQIALVLTLIANYAAVLADPALGMESGRLADPALNTRGDAVWRGIMGQKNWAGLTCAVTILLFAFYAGRVHVVGRVTMAGAAAYFLLRSDSQTSMIMCVLALAVGALFTWLTTRFGQRQLAAPAWAWTLWVAAAATIAYLALNAALVVHDLVNDPAGLTGRTQIWAALVKAFVDRPWFGIGYGSFWDLGPQGPIYTYATSWVATMSQGHNGYLDLLVQIGTVGTLIVLFATLVWPTQRLLRGGDHPARALAAALIVFCLGHNFSESGLFDRDSLSQVLLLTAIALLWAVTAAGSVPGRPNDDVATPKPGDRVRSPLRL